jgi:hypothetical protein
VRREIRQSLDTFSFCRSCPFADRPTSESSLEAYDLRTGASRIGMGAAPPVRHAAGHRYNVS